jgi:hypothetical protein
MKKDEPLADYRYEIHKEKLAHQIKNGTFEEK